MEKSNLIIEAKREFTVQLIKILTPFIYQGMNSIWSISKDTFIEEYKKNRKASTLAIFQGKLSLIPKWNQDVINSEYNRIINDHETCDEICLNKIIEAIFISNIQILSTVKLNSKNKKLNVKVPNSKHFIHKCYIEVARGFYTQPFLFEDRSYKISSNIKQENVIKCNKLIAKSIENTISSMLPIKDILQEYLYESEGDSDNESLDSEKESVYSGNINDQDFVDDNVYKGPDTFSGGNLDDFYKPEEKKENVRTIFLGEKPDDVPEPQETPVFPQETPVFPQETPVFPQETPVFPQETPVFPQETPVFPQETLGFPNFNEPVRTQGISGESATSTPIKNNEYLLPYISDNKKEEDTGGFFSDAESDDN
jgi:hypothetical protein